MDLINFSYHHYNLVSSTNEIAKEIASNHIHKEGLVVFANEQSAGKGVGQTKWVADHGANILTTFLLCPNIPIKDQFVLNLVAAVAVLQLVESFNIKDVSIKWPNDILVQNKKIAGILIENKTSGDRIKESYMGIGLNVNQLIFKGDFNKLPTSLKMETNSEYVLFEVLEKLGEFIAINYDLLKSNPIELYQKFIDKMYLMDQLSRFKVGDEILKLTIRGISKDGKLVVEDEQKNKMYYQFKEIQFIN